MAVDAIVFADNQNQIVIDIPVVTPTSVNAVAFTESKLKPGMSVVKKEGQKNAVFVS